MRLPIPSVRLLHLLSTPLVVLGARLSLIGQFGPRHPVMDQWLAEGMQIYRPYALGTLRLADFFRPNNEHRVALTRLFNFGLLLVDGAWDARVQMVFNCLLALALAIVLWLSADELLGARWRLLTSALVATVLAAPFAWENTLVGFNSQNLVGVLGAGLALRLWLGPRQTHRNLALGALVAIAAMLTTASGAFIPMAAILVAIISPKTAWSRRGFLARLVLWTALAGVGVALVSRPLGLGRVAAHSPVQFASALTYCLAWPGPSFFLVALLPLASLVVAIIAWRHGLVNGPPIAAWIAIGLWALIASASVAFARADPDYLRASRYTDIFALWFAVALVCALLLAQARVWPSLTRALCAAMIVVAVIGFAQRTAQGLYELGFKAEQNGAQRRRLRYFLATDDPRAFNVPTALEAPYPDHGDLVKMLRDPAIRRILPSSLVPRRPGPLEQISNVAVRAGPWLLALGLMLFAYLAEQLIALRLYPERQVA